MLLSGILITDLNLTMDQAKEFESKVNICDKEIMMFLGRGGLNRG
jgi:hypothetical protein